MRSPTLVGLIVGAAALVGGVGYAAAKKREHEGGDNFFLYTVQPGDTLSGLALKFFGDAEEASVLFRSIEKIPDSPEKTPVGAKIRVPCIWVTVQPGDTLAAIAQRTLGDGRRWRRIMEANRNASSSRLKDPNSLAVGQRLAVPVVPKSPQAPEISMPPVKVTPTPMPEIPGPPVTSAPMAVIGSLEMLGAELW